MIDRNNFKNYLQKEVNELKGLKNKIESSIEAAPEGSLNVAQKKNQKPEFYLYKKGEKRKYISKKEIEFARSLAQKEYNKSILEIIDKRLTIGEKMLAEYGKELDMSFQALQKAKKELVHPIIFEGKDYIETWYEAHPGGQNEYPIQGNIFSNKGEQVRSKSEKILADLFCKHDIPYVYEPKIILGNRRVIYPDFLLLNVQFQKTVIFEHFGLMGNDEYSQKVCEKIALYELFDYMPGDNFLFSMESQNNPLNTKIVEKMVEKYLKG